METTVLACCLAVVVLFGVGFMLVVHRLAIEQAKHAKCIAHVSEYVGDRFAAQVLRAAAEDYSSTRNIPVLRTMAREGRKRMDLSLPSEWLMDRADMLDPTDEP